MHALSHIKKAGSPTSMLIFWTEVILLLLAVFCYRRAWTGPMSFHFCQYRWCVTTNTTNLANNAVCVFALGRGWKLAELVSGPGKAGSLTKHNIVFSKKEPVSEEKSLRMYCKVLRGKLAGLVSREDPECSFMPAMCLLWLASLLPC